MLFVSSQFYALGRQVGITQAVRQVQIQLQAPNSDSLPVVRTIHRLRLIDELQLRLDTGATCIGKARSRAFDAALKSGCEVWIAVDDDCEATTATLRWLIEAVRSSDGICTLPYLLRGSETKSTTLSLRLHNYQTQALRALSNGGLAMPALEGGFGLVAMSRHAMVEIAAANQDTLYEDDDGERKLGLFHEIMKDGKWYGEDISFFRRVPTNVTIETLCTGETAHGKEVLKLEHLMAYVERTRTQPVIEDETEDTRPGVTR
jgi:hypothetical protein